MCIIWGIIIAMHEEQNESYRTNNHNSCLSLVLIGMNNDIVYIQAFVVIENYGKTLIVGSDFSKTCQLFTHLFFMSSFHIEI